MLKNLLKTVFVLTFMLQCVFLLPVPDIVYLGGTSNGFAGDQLSVKRTNETNVLHSEHDVGTGLVGMDLTFGSQTDAIRNKQTLTIGDNFESLETKKEQKQKEGGFSLFGFRLFNFGSNKKTATQDSFMSIGSR